MEKIKIANCRGKRPVINDICRCLRTLSINEFEMNRCELRTIISDFRSKVEKILVNDNPDITIYK